MAATRRQIFTRTLLLVAICIAAGCDGDDSARTTALSNAKTPEARREALYKHGCRSVAEYREIFAIMKRAEPQISTNDSGNKVYGWHYGKDQYLEFALIESKGKVIQANILINTSSGDADTAAGYAIAMNLADAKSNIDFAGKDLVDWMVANAAKERATGYFGRAAVTVEKVTHNAGKTYVVFSIS